MIDIMETIQEKYVPRSDKEKGLKTVFFGGGPTDRREGEECANG